MESLAVVGIETAEPVISLLVSDPDGVRVLVGEGPFNTDDRPLVEYAGPRWKQAGEEAGAIAIAFAEQDLTDWRTVLARWSDEDARRIDAQFGWLRALSRATPASHHRSCFENVPGALHLDVANEAGRYGARTDPDEAYGHRVAVSET